MLRIWYDIENTESSGSSVVVCAVDAVRTCWLSCCLATFGGAEAQKCDVIRAERMCRTRITAYSLAIMPNIEERIFGKNWSFTFLSLCTLWMLYTFTMYTDHIEKYASNISSVVLCVFAAIGTCLPYHCLTTLAGRIQIHKQQGDLISLP
jgi:hypothetical protein